MARINFNSGAQGVLIAYLRKHGGSAIVNCKQLSERNKLYFSNVWVAANYMAKIGLLTMQKNGFGKPPLITLNEEAIKQYESGKTSTVRSARQASRVNTRSDAMSAFQKIYTVVSSALDALANHKFTDASGQRLVSPLLEAAKTLLKQCENFYTQIENLAGDISKLTEAAKGLSAEEEQIRQAATVDSGEIAKHAEYIELGPVPIIDFSQPQLLLYEPSSIFKQVATLQAKTRELRGLLVEMQRESARLTLVRSRLNELISELQSAEPAVDVLAAMADWKQKSDRYVSGRVAPALAVVSSKI